MSVYPIYIYTLNHFLSICLMTLSEAILPMKVPPKEAAKLAQPPSKTPITKIYITLVIMGP